MIPTKEMIRSSFDGRFSIEFYEKLQSAKVAVAGLGGLGSHISVMLARAGIGELFLVDFDIVDISNLNRQEYDIRHLGIPKTEALAQRLNEINPYLILHTQSIRVTPQNVSKLFNGYPIVCEAFDQPDQKAMLINTLLAECPDTAVISGNGMAGFGDANQIRTKKIGKRLYLCGDGQTDIQQGIGLMAPRVSICAGHQANQVIRLILQTDFENLL